MAQSQTASVLSPGPGSRSHLAISVISALTIVASTYLIRGYYAYVGNHSLQLLYVQMVMDPSLFENDIFAQAMRGYCSFYWVGVAWLGKFMSVETILHILYVLTLGGGLFAVFRLCRALFPDEPLAPWIAAAVAAFGFGPVLGGGTIFISYAEQSSLSIVLFALAFVALIRNMPIPWALLFVAGCWCNVLYGAHTAVYYALVAIFLHGKDSLSKKWIGAAILTIILNIPLIVWMKQSALSMTPSSPEFELEQYALSMARSSHHLYPLMWKALDFAKHFAVVSMVVAIAIWHGGISGQARRMCIAMTIGSFFWLGATFIVAYVVPHPVLLALQPARANDLFYLFVLIVLVGALVSLVRSTGKQIYWYLGALLLAISVIPRIEPSDRIGCLVGLGITAIIAIVVSKQLHARIHPALIPAAIVLSAAIAMMAFRPSESRTRPQPIPDRHEILEIAEWARSTSKDAIFMIDPLDDNGPWFRLAARRALFASWKDATGHFFSAPFSHEFTLRMQSLGYDVREANSPEWHGPSKFDLLSDSALKVTASGFRTAFAIVGSDRTTFLPELFRNSRYKVLSLKN